MKFCSIFFCRRPGIRKGPLDSIACTVLFALYVVQVMKLIDITGQTFGRLQVLRKATKPCMWECLCTCGTVRFYSGTNLRTENTTSCGCLHKEKLAASNRALKTEREPWLADMSFYVRKLGYRTNRKVTGKLGSNQFQAAPGKPHSEHPSLIWRLNLDEYIQLVTSECFYCGRSPHQTPQGIGMLGLKRNGIDRVDNLKGYVSDNCVSCCTSCNREKRAQTQAEFVENTRRRYENLKKKGLL